MGDITANFGPVFHNRSGYRTRGIKQDGIAVANEGGTIQFCLACQCADAQLTIGLPDVLQAINAVDVDQDRGASQTKTQERDEALATGQNFSLLMFLQ